MIEAVVDNGLLSVGSGRMDDIESVDDIIFQFNKSIEDAEPFKRYSIRKEYVEGRLWVILCYSSAAIAEPEKFGSALMRYECYVSKSKSCFIPGGVDEIQMFEMGDGNRRNEGMVLVSNVERMEAIEAESPVFVWLHSVQDRPDYGVTGLMFLSVDGSLKRRLVPTKRKLCPLVDGAAIGFQQDTVRVVERSPQIMNGIAKHCRGVPWESWGVAPARRSFQRVVVALGSQSFSVITDVVPEDGFELTDVMFGPFDLQVRTEKVDGHGKITQVRQD